MATTATTVMNTIVDTEEKALEALVSAQGPVVDYARKVVDYLDTAVPALPTRDLGQNLPTIKQFVDNQFAFAARMLDAQHTFVIELLDVTKPVADKVIAQKPATGARKLAKTNRKPATEKTEADAA